jgi:hypothetical protein
MRAEAFRFLVQLYAAGVVLTLSAAACSGTASEVRAGPPDHSPKSLYPLAAGYAWSYDVETEGSPPVLAVARVARFDAGVASVVTGPEASQRYSVTDAGIQRAGEPRFLLKAPITLGAMWESGAGTEARVASVNEQVTTTAGNFAACVVVEEQNRNSGQTVKTTYCPGVGPTIVVSQMEVRGQLLSVTARLRGYSLESLDASP